jgi:hypothetical protein
MTQAQIDGEILNAIDADHLAALKEYRAAAQEVTDAGPTAGNLEVIAKSVA